MNLQELKEKVISLAKEYPNKTICIVLEREVPLPQEIETSSIIIPVSDKLYEYCELAIPNHLRFIDMQLANQEILNLVCNPLISNSIVIDD